MLPRFMEKYREARMQFKFSAGYCVWMVCVVLLGGCGLVPQPVQGVGPKVTIRVTNHQGDPIANAPLEFIQLFEDGTETSPSSFTTDMAGEYQFSIFALEDDDHPTWYSVQVWVRAVGYKPTRQIVQVDKETTILFKLDRLP